MGRLIYETAGHLVSGTLTNHLTYRMGDVWLSFDGDLTYTYGGVVYGILHDVDEPAEITRLADVEYPGWPSPPEYYATQWGYLFNGSWTGKPFSIYSDVSIIRYQNPIFSRMVFTVSCNTDATATIQSTFERDSLIGSYTFINQSVVPTDFTNYVNTLSNVVVAEA